MRICLVASELLGAHKNGGIGTATSHLACLISRFGHDVKVLYTGSEPIDFSHPWVRRLQSLGIELSHLRDNCSPVRPRYLREAASIFEYLRLDSHDLILFQDWNGGAASCVQARRAGLAFAQTRLAVIAHGPTEWLLAANRHPVRDRVTLVRLHMEREVFDGADAIICPSRYMLEWLGKSGVCLERASVLPLYLWSDSKTDQFLKRTVPIKQVSKIAFFGRMEERKGVDIFIKAILDERIAFSDIEILFAGKEASVSEHKIRKVIQLRRPNFKPRLRFEKNLDTDEAQALLIENDYLAIVPSLTDNAPCVISECVRRRIPLIASKTGGIPELISTRDHGRVLVDPNATSLATRLSQVINQPFLAAGPAYHENDIANRWRTWIDAQVSKPINIISNNSEKKEIDRLEIAHSGPDVAIILTHYERPQLLDQALESFAVQTDLNFELVLVDDGSTSAAAVAKLEDIEAKIWPFPLKVIRGNNVYLGAARNAGLRTTNAKQLIFFDDDNIAFPNFVEVLSKSLKNTDSDIVTCQMSIFCNSADEPDLALLQHGERWSFAGGPPELGLSVNCFGDATGIYKRSVFDRIGCFHEWRDVGHEDWHLHARAAIAGLRHVCLPVPLYWYRRTEAGMLQSTDPYENNRVIWDVYRAAIPHELTRLVDLSIKNIFSGEDPLLD